VSADLEEVRKRARFMYAYLNQGEWWFPDGRPRVRIADMDESWRRNAAAFLLRHARGAEFRYTLGELDVLSTPVPFVVGVREDGTVVERTDPSVTLGPSGDMACDAFDREVEERRDHPEEWLKVTTLYQALTA
jgi:hypothetical protein